MHVQQPGQVVDQDRLEEHRRLLADLGGRYHEVVGTDVASALCDFARARHATQLVLGATRRNRWAELRRGSVVNAVLREAGDLDVHVIGGDADTDSTDTPGDRSRSPARPAHRARRQAHIPARRRATAAVVALASLVVLALALARFRPEPNLPTDLLLFLLVVLGAALLGGFTLGVATAVVAADRRDLVPHPTSAHVHDQRGIRRGGPGDLPGRVGGRERPRVPARRSGRPTPSVPESRPRAWPAPPAAWREARTPSARSSMPSASRSTGTVSRSWYPTVDGWRVEATGGAPIDTNDPALSRVDLPGGAQLVHDGPLLNSDDQRVLAAFAAQLGHALERRRLEGQAARAAAAAQGDRLRTAILRAVSHDLRTPLASIKASATSLLQDDIAWAPDAQREFLEAIDEEADRLDAVVGDLLDMSRLEAGVVRPALSPVGLDEVVHSALASLSETTGGVVACDVPSALPPVLADPALLQRSVANLVANALRHGSADGGPSVVGRSIGTEVELRVVDHGPGVPARDREQLFEPFRRLGDRQGPPGVGLGLAVARGFVDAMGGQLRLDDTPGGGLTAVVTLPSAPASAPADTIVAGVR